MAFQFRCVVPDEPPLTELVLRSEPLLHSDTSAEKRQSLKSLLEKKLGELASCPERWPPISLNVGGDSFGEEEKRSALTAGIETSYNRKQGNVDPIILESPVTPANGMSLAHPQPVYKPSLCQFISDESPQWSDSMATPPVTWRTPVTPKGNENELLESTLESECCRADKCTSLAASLESVETADSNIIDIDEFLFGDISAKMIVKQTPEKGVAQTLFITSAQPTVDCLSHETDPAKQDRTGLLSTCEHLVNCSHLSTATCEAGVAIPIEETPAKRSRLEMVGAGPVAQSTPLTRDCVGVSPVLFDSPQHLGKKLEADENELKGDILALRKSQDTTSNVTPMVQSRTRAKPRRLSLSRAFAYPTNSQIRRCSNEATRPSHRYSTRLARKMNLMTNGVCPEDETLSAAQGSADVGTGVSDEAFCDSKVTEMTDLNGTELGQSSNKSKQNDLSVSAFTISTNSGMPVGLASCNTRSKSVTLRVGCSSARKRPPGSFKIPRPARKIQSRVQVKADEKIVSSSKNAMLSRVGDSSVSHSLEPFSSVSVRTVSGDGTHAGDAVMMEDEELMAMTDDSCFVIDDKCSEKNPDGKECQLLVCEFQAKSINDVSVSSDFVTESKQSVEFADVLETSGDHSISSALLGLNSSFGHCQEVQLGTRERVSVLTSSVVTASDQIENVDVANTLADSKFQSVDTQQKARGNSEHFKGFQTGSGKRISVSASSMAKAKRLLESVDSSIESLGIGKEPSHTSLSTTSEFSRTMTGNSSFESDGSFQGFQTVSGKPISVSAASLVKAKLLFESIQLSDSGILSGQFDSKSCNLGNPSVQSDGSDYSKQLPVAEGAFTDCQPAIGGRETVSTGVYNKLSPEDMQTVGFQTAAGKLLCVSGASLRRAKQFVEELDEDIVEAKAKKELPGTAVAVNLSDAEAQELAEACVADEVKSSDAGDSLCDPLSLADDLDLSVFTQKTSWEVRESVKALLQSNSQDSNHTILDGAPEDCDGSNVHVSSLLLDNSQTEVNGMTEEATDQTECSQNGLGMLGLPENILCEDSLLTESLLRDTDKEYDAPDSQSNMMSMSREALHRQPENCSEDGHNERPAGVTGSELLDGELLLDGTALNDGLLNMTPLLQFVSGAVDTSCHEENDHEMQVRESPQQESSLTVKLHPVFMTASGHAVGVSESALQLAKQQLDNENCTVTTESVESSVTSRVEAFATDCQLERPKTASFPGFCTAAGKKVAISEEALAKAKATLDESLCYTSNNDGVAHHMDKVTLTGQFSGFQTASGRNVTVSEQALDEVRRQDRPGERQSFVGFQTASGQNVTVSEDALQQAKRILNDDQDTVERVQVTKASGLAPQSFGMPAVQCNGQFSAAVHSDSRLSEVNDAVVPAVGFQTAKGASVAVSEKSLQEARHLLDEDQVVTLDMGGELNMSSSSAAFTSHRPQSVGRNGQTHSYCPYRRMSSAGDVNATVLHQISNSRCSSLKPLRSSISAMANDCRTPLGAVGRRPLQTQSGRDCGANNVRWFKSWNPPLVETNTNVPVPRDARFGSRSAPVFSYSSTASIGGDKNNMPFMRRSVPDRTIHHTQTGSIMNKNARQVTPTPMFKTPYKKSVELMAHQSATASSDKTLRHTRKQLVAVPSAPANGRLTPDSSSCYELDSHPEDQKTSKITLTGQELEVMAVKQTFQNVTAEPQLGSGIVRPCIGSWLRRRGDNAGCRLSLHDFAKGQVFLTYSKEELLRLGVRQEVLTVSSATACDFRFYGENHFSKAVLTGNHTVRLRDGGQLQLDSDGKAGVKEFIQAMSTTSGVDTKLISDEWICNHYRWIVWKLAAMEVAFPSRLAGRCLTPECVASQLKYRYDREVDRNERSCLKKIFERDDVASRLMILCVAGIDSDMLDGALRIVKTRLGNKARNSTDKDSNSCSATTEMSPVVIVLTDGWYSIRAEFDEPLLNLVKCGKIGIGTKLCIYGAQVCGLTDACPPLEAPAAVFLRVRANSSRRAVWYARLGYQSQKRPFPVPLSSIYPSGGLVGCIDVLIQRQYPLQWMERTDGICVFRTTRAEEKVARKHDELRQKHLEAVYERLEKDMENDWKQDDSSSAVKELQALSSETIASMDSGEDIDNVLMRAPDPRSLEAALSVCQRKALEYYRQQNAEWRHSRLHTAVEKALKDDCSNWKDRAVVALLRLRVSCCLSCHEHAANNVLLSVWRPSEDLLELLVENKRFRIFNLNASPSRYSACNEMVQLSTSRATCYQEVEDTSGINDKLFSARTVLSLSDLASHGSLFLPPFREFDTVGVVISIRNASAGQQQHRQSNKSPVVLNTVYLADEEQHLLAVKFWGGLSHLGIDRMLHQKAVIAVANLRWHEGSNSSGGGIPCAVANELTVISLCPKERYLQIAVEELQSRLPASLDEFVCALDTKISQSSLHDPRKRFVRNTNFYDEMDDPEIEQWAVTADLQVSLQTANATISGSQGSRQRDASLLQRLPSPPPLAQLPVLPSSAVRREFEKPKLS